MFNDVKTSRDAMQDFRAWLDAHGVTLALDLSVQARVRVCVCVCVLVLTTGSWPQSAPHTQPLPTPTPMQVLTTGSWPQSTAQAAAQLPREMEEAAQQFTQFYLSAYSGG